MIVSHWWPIERPEHFSILRFRSSRKTRRLESQTMDLWYDKESILSITESVIWYLHTICVDEINSISGRYEFSVGKEQLAEALDNQH